jgi:gamma-glutamylcyclotransferase (GGCT)/AIG2-like uncharacterized protein YtfP
MTELCWWQNPSSRDGLLTALAQINDARARRRSRPGWEMDACSDNFGALNQLATNLDKLPSPPIANSNPNRLTDERSRSETQMHASLVTQLSNEVQVRLLSDTAVAAFACFEPLVLDHSSWGMSQVRVEELSPQVVEEASSQHREFRNAWLIWNSRGSGVRNTLRALVRAVLVVRNNMAHGEKTPSGPDRERGERNRTVARTVLPVLEVMLDLVLDEPSRRLAAYGTLQRRQPNHSIVTVPGQWSAITLNGSLWDESGLPAFQADATGEPVTAELFESVRLPELWESLDEFEGRRYTRRLGLFHRDGTIGVANVYEWAGQNW